MRSSLDVSGYRRLCDREGSGIANSALRPVLEEK